MNKILIIGGVVVLVAFVLITIGQSEPDAVVTTVTEPVPATNTDPAPMATEESMGTIVDIAVATPETSTLVAAVTAAGLVETLASEGPFTVFAPVNEAFAALPAGTVETLLQPANLADLQAILTYHVVPSAVLAGDLTDGMVVETVNGATLTINVAADGGVSINGSSNVIAADIIADNGVIHLIDAVLLP